MGESKITVKDMRVGEFQYNLAENLKSPIIQIRKDGLYTPNFLFTCQDANLEDLVLVENDVRLVELTLDRLHGLSEEAVFSLWRAEKLMQVSPSFGCDRCTGQ